MISLRVPGNTRLCDGWTRREVLRVGGIGSLGLTLSGHLSAEAAGLVRAAAKARSVILIFNCGGPSHLDLWDMKPDASSDIRGPWKPIPTNVDGIQISELMPELAKRADRYSIIRTVHHRQTQHNTGMYNAIVGRPYPIDSTLINPSRNDYPSFGTLVGWLAQQEGHSQALPPYHITPAPHCDSTVYLTPGQYGGFLGGKYDPFVLNADPNARDFKVANVGPTPGVTLERSRGRRALLEAIDRGLEAQRNAAMNEFDGVREKAFSMVTAPEVKKAFDLTLEPDSVRDRYGRHTWGQSHLLARRLIEAGARFVTTVNGQSIVWDTHKDHVPRMKDRLVPPMEKAFTALLDDLTDRGLLDSTLVIWMGDFGRTPKFNNEGGRDHWPQCYSVVMAGGGVRGGQIIGRSDAMGAFPDERAVHCSDIHATTFKLLGYDPQNTWYPSNDGRPIPLSEGTPVKELL